MDSLVGKPDKVKGRYIPDWLFEVLMGIEFPEKQTFSTESKGIAATFLSYALLAYLLVFVLAGCQMAATVVKPLEPAIEDVLRREELSLVLVKVRPDTRDRSFSTYPWSVRLGVARIDTGEPIAFDSIGFSPSAELQKEGWRYGALPPGNYFLQAGWSVSNVVSPSFRFEIPKGKPLVYIGSLATDCVEDWKAGKPSCSEPRIIDETDQARAVAQSSFAQLQVPATEIMQSESTVCDPAKIISRHTSLHITSNPGVKYSSLVDRPSWINNSMKTWVGLGGLGEKTQGSDEMMRDLMGVPVLNAIPIVLVSAWLVTLPVTATVGAITGSAQQSRWETCLKALPEQLNQIDSAQLFNGEFAEKLRSKGYVVDVETQQASWEERQEGLIEITVLGIFLRPFRQGDNCLSTEIMVHARISDSTNATSTCGKTYRFGVTSYPKPNYYPYAMHGSSSVPCRQIESICGSEGPTILKEDLLNTVREAAVFIVDDLNRLKKEKDQPLEAEQITTP
jgi:hypothetical protein